MRLHSVPNFNFIKSYSGWRDGPHPKSQSWGTGNKRIAEFEASLHSEMLHEHSPLGRRRTKLNRITQQCKLTLLGTAGITGGRAQMIATPNCVRGAVE